MAMFRQHITLGAILSTIGVVLILLYSLVLDPLHLAIFFALCSFGSILPDFDSDSGIPFYLTFGAATLAFAGLVLYYTLSGHPQNNYILIGVPLAALIGFWFIVGGLVKHCTHHRGIWHSLPMLAIASIITYLAAEYFQQGHQYSVLLGLAMGAGFLSHLILDELWAGVDVGGAPFVPNKAFGTALKFFAESRLVNLFTYGILFALIYISIHGIPAV
jgi:membrane-bound metal-dependent hydrolase YbcI (DUF457 family)